MNFFHTINCTKVLKQNEQQLAFFSVYLLGLKNKTKHLYIRQVPIKVQANPSSHSSHSGLGYVTKERTGYSSLCTSSPGRSFLLDSLSNSQLFSPLPPFFSKKTGKDVRYGTLAHFVFQAPPTILNS